MSIKQLNIAPANVDDYRVLAQKRLPKQFFDYIDGGSYQEITAKSNVSAFETLQLRQRVLRDVTQVCTQTTLFERTMDMPVILAPIGLAGCYARRGEVQALNAANKSNIPFCLSTVGICSIDELAQHANAPFWFQLYVIKDRSYTLNLLNKAKQAGCDTIVFTVDLPVLGERYRDIRNGLSGNKNALGSIKRAWDFISHPRWLWDVPITGRPLLFGNLVGAVPSAQSLADFKAWVVSQFDASITWQDLAWLREHWHGKLIIKGILEQDDAEQAVNLGADAIVVSNHGGRQLDGVPATLSVLPEIVKLVDNRCKVIVDGGIRSGIDVVKAMAMGADACMIGRAWAYALAAQGERGVVDMLTNMKNEMRVTMTLTGVTQISALNKDILR